MRRLATKYRALLAADWSVMFAYRSETVIWMIGSFAQPLVSLAVWLSIAGGGTVAGYAAGDYVVYFCGVLLVDRLTRTWDVWELDRDIREGTISAKLLRPLHPIHWSITENVTYKLFFALVLVPAWLLLAVFVPGARLTTGAAELGLAAAAVLLAAGIRFLIGYGCGLLAFWTNRATGIYMVYEMIHLFLAGRLAPLEMFPDAVREAALWLPFYVTVAFPVELLTGQFAGSARDAGLLLLQQAGWFAALALALRLLWRAGVKRYSAVGG